MGDRHLPKVLCKCAICVKIKPDGCLLSRQRYRSHKNKHMKSFGRNLRERIERGGAITCLCDICIARCPNGVPFTNFGYMKHLESVKMNEQYVSLTDLQEHLPSTSLDSPLKQPTSLINAAKPLDGDGHIHLLGHDLQGHDETLHACTDFHDQLPHDSINTCDETVHKSSDQNELPREDKPNYLHDEESQPTEIARLDHQLLECILELQGCLDLHNASEKLQDDLLSLLFQGKDRKCLASIIADRGSWNGMVNGFRVPTSLKCMKNLYQSLGLPRLQRHAICIHDKSEPTYAFKTITDGVILTCMCKRKRDGTLQKTSKCLEHETCTICGKTRKDAVVFLYNPIGNLMRLRCSSKSIAYSDLEHWRQRESWLGKGVDERPPTIRECWHASRWREMQYFWDPSTKWELPIICKHCQNVMKTWPLMERDECFLQGEFDSSNNEYIVTCPQCLRQEKYKRADCYGDPRNLALLLHWDGFQSTRSTIRSSGVIRLVVLNGGRDEGRAMKELTFPVLFIPKESVISCTDSLDPFLEPLVAELQDLFMTGKRVDYSLGVNAISPGLQQVFYQRCILYAITADHPAQCEILKLSSGGKAPCRRCDVVLPIAPDGKYYYVDLLKKTRLPNKKKTMDHVLDGIQKLKDGVPNAARDTGVRGSSMFLKLFYLYGFDLFHHSIVDSMHTIALNLLCKCNKMIFDQIKAAGNEKVAMDRLEMMIRARTLRMKSGRYPKDPFRRFGFFKAQEHQVYSQWYADYVASDLVSESEFAASQIATDLTRIFYDYARTNGWSTETVGVAKTLLQAWRLHWNELSGPNAAPLEHMAGECHILDDIEVIGPPDITWCYFFESTFGKLIEMPTNKKEMELTYARVENRLLFSKIYRAKTVDTDGMLPPERADAWFKTTLSNVEQNRMSTGVICAKSQTIALDLWAACKRYEMIVWKELISNKGILIGYGEKRECTKEEEIALKNTYNLLNLLESEVLEYRAVMLKGSIFRKGDTVVVRNENISDGHWYGKVRYIFLHKQGLETNVFFAADYYRYYITDGQIQLDVSTGMPILAQGMEPFDHESILPVRHILREICILPMRAATDKRSIAFETMTNKLPDRLLQLKVGNIPVWPLEGDIVAVQAVKHGVAPHLSSYDGCWYAIVTAVNETERRVKLTWLKSASKSGQECFQISYEEKRWQSWNCLLRVMNCRKEGRGRNICYFRV